jgi:catechol 2,3-dioxygenase-like lactoylglutathione lyase family enzyme
MSPSKSDITIGEKARATVLSPSSLAHVVWRTAKYQELIDFWTMFLGATVTHKDDSLTFLPYDEEHHRIAIIAVPGTLPRDGMAAGIHHLAFSYNRLADLLQAYKQRKELGMLPKWSVNHGPTTSIYYEDPDGNVIETQVDNFDTSEAATDFMSGPLFATNQIGTDIDPEVLYSMVQNGVAEKELKKRIEIGPRSIQGESETVI